MNSKYCVDTHSVAWFILGKKTISRRAKSLLRQALDGKIRLVFPTMVVLEAFHMGLKDPDFKFPTVLAFIKDANGAVAAFDKKILLISYKLPRDINIHDRVIAATAIAYGCPLISRDPVLAKIPGLKTVW